MRYTDDAARVHAAQATPEAFGALYERYHPMIFGYAHRCTHDQMQAEDIAAETFLRAMRALGRYEERGMPFSAWLFRIATNQLIQQGRRGRGITFQPLDSGQACEGSYARAANQGGHPFLREGQDWLCAGLGRLSPDQRSAIWLRFWRDYSIREVAARLGRTEAATKALLHRTLKGLRAQPRMCA